MNYPEYAEKIKNIPYPAQLEYHIPLVHFHCDLAHAEGNPEFYIKAGKKDITELFRIPD